MNLMNLSQEDKDKLTKIHELRMRAHWGKNYDTTQKWPQTDEQWRQTPHGAPWDSNVDMAIFHLKLAQQIKDAGLLK